MIRIKPTLVFKTICVVLLGLLISFFLLVGTDKFLGFILDRTNYFKAMTPFVTVIWEGNEFTFLSHTSSQGLRNEEIIIPKPKDTYRILALGDSFTWGWGVNLQDSWVKKLEEKMQKQNKEIEIVNAGVYGTSLTSQLTVCEDYADRLDVDMILLGFYGIDDLDQELMSKRTFEKERVWTMLRTLFPTFYKIKHPLVLASDVPSYSVHHTLDTVRENARRTWEEYPDLVQKLDPRIREDYLSGRLIVPWVQVSQVNPNYYTSMLNDSQLKQAIEAVSVVLDKIKRYCVNGRPFVMVLIPSMEIVSAKYHEYRVGLGFSLQPQLAQLDLDTPLRQIVEVRGFTYLSLLESFRADTCPNCYYPWDSHFTPHGNERVAEFLKTKLLPIIQDAENLN